MRCQIAPEPLINGSPSRRTSFLMFGASSFPGTSFPTSKSLYPLVCSVSFSTPTRTSSADCQLVHLESDEIADLPSRARVMFEAIRDARERRLAETNPVASTETSRSQDTDNLEMISEAFAIVLRHSCLTGAMQWLTHAPPQTVRAAATEYPNTADFQSGMSVTAPHSVPLERTSPDPATPQGTVTEPGTPESAPASEGALSTPFTDIPLTLFPSGTQIILDLSPIDSISYQTRIEKGRLTLDIPSEFYTAGIRQSRLPPPSIASVMGTADQLANTAPPLIGYNHPQPTRPHDVLMEEMLLFTEDHSLNTDGMLSLSADRTFPSTTGESGSF